MVAEEKPKERRVRPVTVAGDPRNDQAMHLRTMGLNPKKRATQVMAPIHKHMDELDELIHWG